VGQTRGRDDRRVLRAIGHRSYLAGFTAWTSFWAFWRIFAGRFLWFFYVAVTSTLQLRARDDVRGRVMAMYSIGILGSALVGAPLAGTLADMVGVSDTFLIIAAICAGTAVTTGWIWWSWQLSASTEVNHPV